MLLTCSPELVKRGVKPDLVTDQTSAHDPIHGYLPQGWSVAEWREKQESDPKARRKGGARVDENPSGLRWWIFGTRGVPTLDYGNNIRQVAQEEGLKDAFAFPGFVPAYIRPLFCAVVLVHSGGAPYLAIRKISTKPTPK